MDTPIPPQAGGVTKLPSALKVTVPSELEGIAYIQVQLVNRFSLTSKAEINCFFQNHQLVNLHIQLYIIGLNINMKLDNMTRRTDEQIYRLTAV